MKNKYEIRGDVTVIFVNRKGSQVEVIIDTKDLDVVKQFPNTWFLMNTGTYAGGYSDQYNPEKKKTWLLHRFIMDEPHGMLIDHMNHNTLDNRRSNLRIVTEAENNQNLSGVRKNNSSGIMGVEWNERSKKWRASIQVNKKRIHLGHFCQLDEAKLAVEEARAMHMPFSKESNELISISNIADLNREKSKKSSFRSNNSCGVRNITWANREKSWKVHFTVNKKKIHLGYFKEIEDAKKVSNLFRDSSFGITNKEELEKIKTTVLLEVVPNKPEDSRKKLSNQSGINGITSKIGKWVVRVQHKGKRYYVGMYSDLEEAIIAKNNYEHSLL